MGQKLINEIGNKYGFLTPIELTKDKNGRTAWLCQCDCGNTKIVRGPDLRVGKITTCGRGCPLRKLRNGVFINEVGNRYGLLTVLYEVQERTKDGRIKWHCKCDCGNECDVRGADLRSGNQLSCGCLRSKGEKSISDWLLINNINFQREYTFEDLLGPGKGKLRFDFAILQEGLRGLIEYQGEQHFYPVQAFGGIDTYNIRIQNDKNKYDYCQRNNIPLLILRKGDNIKEKLSDFLGEIL